MKQGGQKSLPPRPAIAKMVGTASSADRCLANKAKQCGREETALEWGTRGTENAAGMWPDRREAKALRSPRLQTLDLPQLSID
jgi:hypothetical protein